MKAMVAVARIKSTSVSETLPCQHSFPSHKIDPVKEIITSLPTTSPHLLTEKGIEPDAWIPLLRAAIESLRGTASATGRDKRRFIAAILNHCKNGGFITSWEFVGSGGRQDYKVVLPSGKSVGIEAKGCPDGNNTTIWDRPTWAEEFIVWSLCPESLAHHPGRGMWSGISNRLMPKIAAERKLVDAYIFWDGRCGTTLRKCHKGYGVYGELRRNASEHPGQEGKEDWVPPPCIYLFPRSIPSVHKNPHPPVHTTRTCEFAAALLNAFGVPESEHHLYTHEASIQARGTSKGTEIFVQAISRGWPDGHERIVETSNWKLLKREA